MQGTLALAMTLCFTWVMLLAGASKLSAANDYRALIGRYLGRESVSVAVVRVIGTVEMILGLALLLPVSRAKATSLVALFLLGYAMAMGRLWMQGVRDMRCGCGGPASDTRIGPALMLRNLLAALLLLLCTVANEGNTPAIALALGLLLVCFWYALDGLIANGQKMQAMKRHLNTGAN